MKCCCVSTLTVFHLMINVLNTLHPISVYIPVLFLIRSLAEDLFYQIIHMDSPICFKKIT